jgi:hypothetical protein
MEIADLRTLHEPCRRVAPGYTRPNIMPDEKQRQLLNAPLASRRLDRLGRPRGAPRQSAAWAFIVTFMRSAM